MSARVSVLMAVFNNARELPRTLAGIRSQRYTDYELIAVNDGSTDDSGALLDAAAAADARIKVVHQANAGLMRALQTAVSHASGELWARHDGDDVSSPDRFFHQVAYLDANPSTVLCDCWAYHVPPDGTLELQALPDRSEVLAGFLRMGWNPFVHGALMWRRSVYQRLPHGYRLEPDGEDYDLLCQFSEAGRLGSVPYADYAYWLNPQGISARSQAFRPALVDLARQLHGERLQHGRELTDVAAAVATIVAGQVPAGSAAARRSVVAYTDALKALRAKRYERYRHLMNDAAAGEGPWAARAKGRLRFNWLAPLLRLAYDRRLRSTPLQYINPLPPDTARPEWLAPYLPPFAPQ